MAKITAGKAVTMATTGAALMAAVVAFPTYWAQIGWTTPATHEADFIVATETVKDFRDEWKCDEWDEELIFALEEQKEDPDDVELERKIEKIRELMEKTDCSRFDDFG